MAEASKAKGGKTTRLMITKMVLENFKSYAGVVEIGPLHKRFSSVVGPNGSGKSNVIDALLFVFGKRAKQLRLNKVSELIHKSSAFPNLEYANVEVHFQLIIDEEDDDDKYEVVPGSDFVVSRIAYQNNSSKYSVDSKTSNFNEVGLLLRSHGIDLDNNRFLILQGEVEQIAMMKPKAAPGSDDGLLEYLEDIIGSNKYVEQIEAWSKTLDELNEKRIEKVNRMKIAERDRDNLSGSRQEAEEYLEIERNIRRKQNLLYQLFIYEAVSIIEEVEAKKQEGQEKLTYEKNKRIENDSKLEESQKEFASTKAKYDHVCETLDTATADYNAYDRRDIKLREDMKHVTSQLKKVEVNMQKEQKREVDSEKDCEKCQKEMVTLKGRITELEQSKVAEEAKLEEILSSLQESTTAIRETVEVKQIDFGKAQSSVSKLQTEKETLTTQLNLVLSRSESNVQQVKACQEKQAKIAADEKEFKGKLTTINASKVAINDEILSLESKIAKNIAEETNIQHKLDESVFMFEEGKMMMQNSSSSHSAVIDALLKASKQGGRLSNAGIRGRLGDLGTIAPEYDVAISTACGGMLDHVVVETVEGGQACLEYMRVQKLGRLSLIVLDQMDAHRKAMEKPANVPAGASRLFDLIRSSSPDLLPAFFCALGNTMVTSNLDSAVKLAYGPKGEVLHRMVTLDGNLLDTSGAMSGGGKQMKSGSMKLSTASSSKASSKKLSDEEMTSAKLAVLETRMKELQVVLANHRQERVAMEKDIKECRNLLKELDLDAEKSKMLLTRLGEQEIEIAAALKEATKNSRVEAHEAAEIQQLRQKIAVVEEQMNASCPNLNALKAEIAALQQSILDIGGPKLKRTQLRISEYSTQLDELNNNYSTKEIEYNNGKKQASKSNALAIKLQQELSSLAEKDVALKAELKDMEQDAMKLLAALENAKALKESQEVFLKETKQKCDQLFALDNEIRTAELDIQSSLETITKTLKANGENKKAWEEKLKSVRKTHMEEKNEMKSLLKSFLTTGASKKNIEIASSSSDGNAMDIEEDNASSSEDADDADIPLSTREEIVAKYGAHDKKVVLKKMKEDNEELKFEINGLEQNRDKLKSNVNMSALMEYLRKDAEYRVKLMDLEAITAERNDIRKNYDECRRKRLDEFMSGFSTITLKLKEMYQMITLGGDAELELVDSLDPFSEGIVFSVRPPKKSWKNISNLSGGEKTLSSLALVFALHHYKPTPLYVMDEIDAALDFKNVSIVANYIKERTKNAQFVIISLRNNMFELADRLVGIYKTHDCTKSVTINPKCFNNCGDIVINDGGSNNTGNINDFKSTAKDAGKSVLKNVTNVVQNKA